MRRRPDSCFVTPTRAMRPMPAAPAPTLRMGRCPTAVPAECCTIARPTSTAAARTKASRPAGPISSTAAVWSQHCRCDRRRPRMHRALSCRLQPTLFAAWVCSKWTPPSGAAPAENDAWQSAALLSPPLLRSSSPPCPSYPQISQRARARSHAQPHGSCSRVACGWRCCLEVTLTTQSRLGAPTQRRLRRLFHCMLTQASRRSAGSWRC